MSASYNCETLWKQTARKDLSTTMREGNGVEPTSIATTKPSYNNKKRESNATCDFLSQRSDDGNDDCLDSAPRRPQTIESIKQLARASDKRLHEVVAAAACSVNWDKLNLELAAADLCDRYGNAWKRKKLVRRHKNSNAMKLFTRYTIRDHRRQTRWGPKGFAVLAEDYLPCTVQELRLVFCIASTDTFRDMMSCVYRREFVKGEILRTINIQRGAGNPVKAFENKQLSVKTVTFTSGNIFSKNVSWCFLELLTPRDKAKEELSARRTTSSTASASSATSPPAFTRTLASIARSNVVLSNAHTQQSRMQSHVPNVVINYLFEQDASGRFTRVVFYGEYLPCDVRDAFQCAGHERRIARSWMLRLAANCHRLLLVVRRRRLGMQVTINSTHLPIETMVNAFRCACCRRPFSTFFKRTRKRLCCLCGFLVCDACDNVQEREHRARGDDRPQIEQVHVCKRCLIRVNQARYTNVTEEDLCPARVIADAQYPTSRALRTLGGSFCHILLRNSRSTFKTRPASLNDLLLKVLVDATAGEPAQRRRKASVLSVMKDIVDVERVRKRSARIGSSSTGITSNGLPLLEEPNSDIEDADADTNLVDDVMERLMLTWDEVSHWEDGYPLANSDSRGYQITFPDDEMKAIIPPIPANEHQRLQLIHEQQLNKLGGVPELDIICSLASRELSCTVSMITIVDKTQLHVLASNHPTVSGGLSYPREQGFCAQTILDVNPLVSRHVQADVRFHAMTSVRQMGINFYCGFPLIGSDGKTVIGSLCCADPQARDLTRSQYAVMRSLATTTSRVVQRAADQRSVREVSTKA